MLILCWLFFFFKQNTAYEVRISDLSSDVCSSDLETVERVRLDTKDFQYLYAEGDQLTFMDKATYDQVQLPRDLLGDAAAFLQDGMDVVMELYEDKPISVQLPDQIEATKIGRASCRERVCRYG